MSESTQEYQNKRKKRIKRIKKIIVVVCIICLVLPLIMSIFLLIRVNQMENKLNTLLSEECPIFFLSLYLVRRQM